MPSQPSLLLQNNLRYPKLRERQAQGEEVNKDLKTMSRTEIGFGYWYAKDIEDRSETLTNDQHSLQFRNSHEIFHLIPTHTPVFIILNMINQDINV